MGYANHFIGVVRNGEVSDAFSDQTPSVACNRPDGAIVEVNDGAMQLLADPNSAEAALYTLAAEKKLDPVFSKEVDAQVAALQANSGIDDATLIDMSDSPFVTIDGADSMDLDQAVFVEPHNDGHIVHYALADAAHYVVPGTPLHAEALRRAASYYMPGIMVPMLPRALSEGLVSLNAKVLRRSVVFSMTLDSQGRCSHTQIQRARICSRAKLSFEAVQSFYDGGDGFESDIDESLRVLAIVGRQRMLLAEERGVVHYRRHEVRARLNSGGARFIASSAIRREVERINEQISLLCNIEGARYLADHGADFVEPIFRVHPAPSPEKMEAFEAMLRALVSAQDLDPSRWLWSSTSQRHLWQYLDELPREGAEGRIAMAIHRQAVMANVRSTFQTEAGSHYGVGAEVYARFSAPMREIVGVFLHHELMEAAMGHGTTDTGLRAQVVQQANMAKSMQRSVSNEGNRLVLDQLFADAKQADQALGGTLMGAERKKAYVRLDEPPIDIKVYLNLAPTKLTASDDGATLLANGHAVHRLGDKVDIQVIEKDPNRDRWILAFADAKPQV